MALSPDEAQLCSGSRNGDLFLWDSATGKRVAKTHVNRNVITAVCWAPVKASPGLVAQTSEDKILRVWDVRTMKAAHTYPRQQYIHTSCDCSADGNLILTSANGQDGHGCYVTVRCLLMVQSIQHSSHCYSTYKYNNCLYRNSRPTPHQGNLARYWEQWWWWWWRWRWWQQQCWYYRSSHVWWCRVVVPLYMAADLLLLGTLTPRLQCIAEHAARCCDGG